MGIVAIAAIVGAVALGLAFAGGGSSYPAPAVVMVALCKALEDRGEVAPLPPSPELTQDLAIRAIVKVLRLGGSWPPSKSDSKGKHAFWTGVYQLAADVRAGKIVCKKDGASIDAAAVCEHLVALLGAHLLAQGTVMTAAQRAAALSSCATSAAADRAAFEAAGPCILAAKTFAEAMACFQGAPPVFDDDDGDGQADDDGDGQADGEPVVPPTWSAIQEAICSILLPLADPDEHYIEQGQLPGDAAVDVAAAALETLGAEPALMPGPLMAQATKYALDLIEGRISCEIEDFIVPTPSTTPKQGGWLLLKYGDNLLAIAGKTYGVSAGSRRTELARAINEHPYNLGLHIPTTMQWNKDNIGPTMISFYNKWRPAPKTLKQRFEAGNAMAVIYLPEL